MRIYISCTKHDVEFADSLMQQLKNINKEYDFISYHTRERIGDDFKEVVSDNIRNSDAVIAIVSENFVSSRYGLMELDWSLAYYYEKHTPVILPVIIDDVAPPYDLLQFLYLDVRKFKSSTNNNSLDMTAIAYKLSESLNTIDVQKRENVVKDFSTRLNDDGLIYIQETKDRLEKQVNRNKILSYICYGLCLLLLAFSIYYCWIVFQNALENTSDITSIVKIGIVGILLISLIIATARFMFTLGKSFMVEAIRNMDRIHAIDFGDFYLKLFKEKFDWLELKEILQNWNIDKGSAFILQDSKEIDPTVLSAIVEYAKNFTKK